ncbi:unnamed protein product [Blepharisma stoltei]|uniref:peptidylprolyl isomerase n=1 Tax=Blepharisma stoltei TaxID=1481888 RepID=A0AAU9IEV1_9CILI|nr:unnamed protein product [Blepharisma stoltei]
MDLFGDGGVIKETISSKSSANSSDESGIRHRKTNLLEKGNEIEINYRGFFEDGTEFDSSYSRNEPFSFKLGEGHVIKGLDQGIATMKIGEKANFIIRSDYAYGEKGMPPLIPPLSILKFEVELIGKSKNKNPFSDSNLRERLEIAKKLKEIGNEKVKSSEFKKAIDECYNPAISFMIDFPIDEDESPDLLQEQKLLKIQLFSNSAICYTKLQDWVKTKEYSEKALQLDPTNIKVIYRKALANFQLNYLEDSLNDCTNGLKLDFNNSEFLHLQANINQRLRKSVGKEKEICKKMFSSWSEKKLPAQHHQDNPKCYFDISIGNSTPKRIVFELFSNIAPHTAEIFRRLCIGEFQYNEDNLYYQGSLINKIIKGLMIEGGIEIDAKFENENYALKHTEEGFLSMTSNGDGTYGTQFMIMLGPAPYLDGKQTVFGKIIEGFELCREIENVQTKGDVPTKIVRIVSSGQLD